MKFWKLTVVIVRGTAGCARSPCDEGPGDMYTMYVYIYIYMYICICICICICIYTITSTITISITSTITITITITITYYDCFYCYYYYYYYHYQEEGGSHGCPSLGDHFRGPSGSESNMGSYPNSTRLISVEMCIRIYTYIYIYIYIYIYQVSIFHGSATQAVPTEPVFPGAGIDVKRKAIIIIISSSSSSCNSITSFTTITTIISCLFFIYAYVCVCMHVQ